MLVRLLAIEALCLTFCLTYGGVAAAVDFECIEVPVLNQRPPDCDDVDHPFYDPSWCTCLTTGLTAYKGGEKAAVEQAIIEPLRQPTVGRHALTVGRGTLDLSQVAVDDEIGQILLDQFIGQGENFVLDFRMVATSVSESRVEFDVVVQPTNPTSIAVLSYDPTDEAHSFGLTFRGEVESGGVNGGFVLTYEYLPPEEIVPPAVSTGIEIGDLSTPGFNVMVLFTFPIMGIYTLSLETPLGVETVITSMGGAFERTFTDSFDIEITPPEVKFRRADANGDGKVDLSDAVATLGYLFLGSGALGCPDAGDANDDGILDISDAVSSLEYQFLGGGQPPAPGPLQCGPDPGADALAACTYTC